MPRPYNIYHNTFSIRLSMLSTRRLLLILAFLATLCVVGLVASALWWLSNERPTPYPKAIYDGMRFPELAFHHYKDCWQVVVLNGWNYHTDARPADVLYWQLAQGYMSNFRYYDATFHESQKIGAFQLAQVRETFIEPETEHATIKTTVKNSLSLGHCL